MWAIYALVKVLNEYRSSFSSYHTLVLLSCRVRLTGRASLHVQNDALQTSGRIWVDGYGAAKVMLCQQGYGAESGW